MKNVLALLISLSIPAALSAQFDLVPNGSIPVTENGTAFDMAWGGGLNFCQVSPMDIDQDGDDDLFIFDRSGDKVVTLLNGGTPNTVDYTHTQDFDNVYPFNELHDWALARDYNCDGKADIFTYSLGGARIFKNISTPGNPAFVLMDTLVRSNYVPTDANLYITSVDLPDMADIDGDGDLDILTFSIFGAFVEYHKNLSMELYGTCDSLVYEVANRCFGYFSENFNTNAIHLDDTCTNNVPNPEFGNDIQNLTLDLYNMTPLERSFDDRAHAGSTICVLDLDANEAMDLLLGDISYPYIVGLWNDGTPNANHMASQDTLFPVYDVPYDSQIFAGSFYVDVNNDGKRDLLASPNAGSLSENFTSFWYYLNVGTDAAPVFDFQQNNIFQQDMIDLGEGAYPVLFDHNSDGLMDLIVANFGYFVAGGNYPCKLALFENTGSATQPEFTLVNRDYENLSSSGIGMAMYPAFGDLDGDGDKDLIIGDLQGRMHRFQNISTGPVADFQLLSPNITDAGNITIDVGQFATPVLFDMDGDGLLDLTVGERNGNLGYYHNTGTAAVAEWTLENDSLGGLDVAEWWNVTGYSTPFAFFNNLGERELVIGSESGWLHHYGNIDGNLTGTFTLIDSTFQSIRTGKRTAVALYDFNADGDLDGVVGNYRGGVSFYMNDFTQSVGTAVPGALFSIAPNPSSTQVIVSMGAEWRAGMQVRILNALGQEVMRVPMTAQNTMIGTEALGTGVYLVEVSGQNVLAVERLVVKK
ncbi:MAG: T9SS type A sorting domain-containing protein [Flavobacteriales bacterium]|nr:T9SS type A sorting domain-containing protein [Flavobacteriales bacterium]